MFTKMPLNILPGTQIRWCTACVVVALLSTKADAVETHPLVKRVQQLEEQMRNFEQALLDAEKAAQDNPNNQLLQVRVTEAKLDRNAARDELRKTVMERDQQIRALKLIQSAIVDKMAEDRVNPSHVLHGTLARLEAVRREKGDWIRAHRPLMRLALYRWPVRPDDNMEEMAKRFADIDRVEPDSLLHRFRLVSRELEALEQQSNWDWQRTGREFWLGYTATLFRSQLADDPAVPWRDRLKQDREHADLYRAGYLEVVRAKRPAFVDPEILRPLSPGLDINEAHVGWAKFNVILTALDDVIVSAIRHDKDPVSAIRLREQTERKFITLLETQKLRPLLFKNATDLVGGGVPSAYNSGPPERKERMIRTLLEHQEPYFVSQFAATVGIPRSARYQWFLSRPFEVDGSETVSTWLEVFTSVLKPMPLWIDDGARNDKTQVEVRPGLSTLEALESILAKTAYRLYFLRPDYLWIGPPREMAGAEKRLRHAEAEAAEMKQLFEDSEAGFVDTSWQDCLDFLATLHSMRVYRLTDAPSGAEIDLDVQAPAYQIIAEVARQAELDWEVFEGRLVIGPTKEFDKFRHARDAHVRRMVAVERLRLEGNKIGRGLSDETETGFIDTALDDAADFLIELHGVTIVVADDVRGTNINCHVSGSNLATALTLMLVEHDLTWDTNGQVIAIGDEESVAELFKN